MVWHITDAQSLAIVDREIDREIENRKFSPAEYEIVRRVIYATADFEYYQRLQFSEGVLKTGAAALAARIPIIVDVLMVQFGIVPNLQKTFFNPVYCATQTITRPQKGKTQTEWGLLTLAQRYPEGVFVIGDSQTALFGLLKLIKEEQIKPTLVIATPASFVAGNAAKQRLRNSLVPNIFVDGRKGNAMVAVAILNGLVDLAWQAHNWTLD
jgi:precorrin-8X/cobalt-precorrin-8 methylmutase